MNKDIIIENFLNEIKSLFPEIAERMEKHDEVMTTSKMEEFSKLTTEAISDKDGKKAKDYLNYMSKKLDNANNIEKEYIDVYYVETLLYDVTDDIKRYGWQFIPDNLQALYIKFWGKNAF